MDEQTIHLDSTASPSKRSPTGNSTLEFYRFYKNTNCDILQLYTLHIQVDVITELSFAQLHVLTVDTVLTIVLQ